MRRSLFALSFALFIAPAPARAQVHPDPSALPARDAHQGLVVAADPYYEEARAKSRFGNKHPQSYGVLALELFFRNDTDQPLRVSLDRILLVIEPPDARRQRLEPLTVEDVLDRMLTKESPGPRVPRTRLPLPRKDSSKQWRKLESMLRSLALEMGLLPPRSTIHGFLFFDLDARWDWLTHSRLYVPEVKTFGGQPLLFFEVDLAPTVSPR